MLLKFALFLVVLLQSSCNVSCKKFTFETINTFLTDVFADDIRYEGLIAYLNQTNSDVVCLQEVWSDIRLFKLREELATIYPHSFSSVHSLDGFLSIPIGKTDSKCDQNAVNEVLDCSITHCKSEKSILDFFKCKFQKCNLSGKLGSVCFECYMHQSHICHTKTANSLNRYDFLLCLRKELFSEEGICTKLGPKPQRNLGLVLFSKIEMDYSKTKISTYNDKVIIKRGYIQVQLKDEHRSTVACTHLSADSTYFLDVAAGFNSWYQLKEDEVLSLISTYMNAKDTYILGDFNMGPELPNENIDGYFTNLYKKLSTANLNNIAVTELKKCTYCSNNGLVKQLHKEFNKNMIIDGLIPVNIRRKFSKIERTILDDVSGPISFEFPISDHWGVKIEFTD